MPVERGTGNSLVRKRIIMDYREIIEIFNMEKHPEGGYYKELYRSEGIIKKAGLPGHFSGDRNFCTDIFYLLPKGEKSALHRIKSDEMWHFYLGGPMTLVQISEDGKIQLTILGQDIKKGHQLQHPVPAGCWFGAYPNADSEYSLMGCTVAPGFDFEDFEMKNRDELLKQFPDAAGIINKLASQ